MVSNLLLMMLPLASLVARKLVTKFAAEAATGKLPAKLQPHAELIGEVCTVLLDLMPASPPPSTEPPAGAPGLKLAEGTTGAAA